MCMMHNYHDICHFNLIFHPVIRCTGAEKQQMANSPVRLLRLLQCSSLSVQVSIEQDKMAAQRMSYQSCKKVQSVVLMKKIKDPLVVRVRMAGILASCHDNRDVLLMKSCCRLSNRMMAA